MLQSSFYFKAAHFPDNVKMKSWQGWRIWIERVGPLVAVSQLQLTLAPSFSNSFILLIRQNEGRAVRLAKGAAVVAVA